MGWLNGAQKVEKDKKSEWKATIESIKKRQAMSIWEEKKLLTVFRFLTDREKKELVQQLSQLLKMIISTGARAEIALTLAAMYGETKMDEIATTLKWSVSKAGLRKIEIEAIISKINEVDKELARQLRAEAKYFPF